MMSAARERSSMADTVARMRATAAEIEALYALQAAAQEAILRNDLAPLRRALERLTLAERVRRGTP